MRAICALVQVAPWPSGSKLTVTFDRFCLNLSLIWAIAFLNASALEPEFHAMTLMVTGPPAAAGALVAGAAGFDSAGLAGALVAAGDGAVDWPHAANTTLAPAPRAREPSRRRRLTYMGNLPSLLADRDDSVSRLQIRLRGWSARERVGGRSQTSPTVCCSVPSCSGRVERGVVGPSRHSRGQGWPGARSVQSPASRTKEE